MGPRTYLGKVKKYQRALWTIRGSTRRFSERGGRSAPLPVLIGLRKNLRGITCIKMLKYLEQFVSNYKLDNCIIYII